MPPGIIDTHIHTWNFNRAEYAWLKDDTSLLNRSYDIEEIADERSVAGITEGVLVQAANNFEDTDWMLDVAERTGWISGVVGWLPLMDPEATAKALREKYADNKYFKGVRHLIHDEPDPKWLLQSSVVESLQVIADHGMSYDLVGILPAHIETALELANKIPGLKMVFDHLNQPPIAAKEKYGLWGELMTDAAKQHNFYMKISGLGTASKNAGWGSPDIEHYIAFVIEHFGENRCLCGGDWPVSLLAGSYTKTWQVYKQVIDSLLNGTAREKVYYRNAAGFYRLGAGS